MEVVGRQEPLRSLVPVISYRELKIPEKNSQSITSVTNRLQRSNSASRLTNTFAKVKASTRDLSSSATGTSSYNASTCPLSILGIYVQSQGTGDGDDWRVPAHPREHFPKAWEATSVRLKTPCNFADEQ
jgi:hypothetical protein